MNNPSRPWRRWLGPFYPFFVALQFMTRLPVPRDLDPEGDDLGRGAAWFPLVGLITGGTLAAIAWGLAQTPWGAGLQIAVLLVAGVIVTGGFHEDGLADAADGVWGGWTKERRLEIMRDSRVGSYGALAIAGLFALRAGALWSIEPVWWGPALIAGHVMGRWSSLPLIRSLPYARSEDTTGVAKPLIEAVTERRVAAATVVALGLTVWLGQGMWPLIGSVWAASLGVLLLGGVLSERYVEGITGDLLGAINVIVEVAVLMCFAWWVGA